MPNFDFECKKCKHEWWDFFQKSDPMPTNCPECKSKKVQKVLSATVARAPLSGQELSKQLATDSKKIRHTISTNENAKANMVGETVYNDMKLREDRSLKSG